MGEVTGSITNILQKLNPNTFNNSPLVDRLFSNWQYDRLEETNNLYKSGIISQANAAEQQLLNSGNGYRVAIPRVTAIDADSRPQRLSSDSDIHGNTDGQTYMEYEIKALEAQSYNFSTVDKYLTGVDQQNNVLNQMTDYWAHQDEERLINVIESTFKNPEIANAKGFHLGNSSLDNAGAKAAPKTLSPDDFMLANARMGDNNTNSVTKIVINSATYWFMRAQNTFNNYIQLPSQSGNAFSTYQGFSIIVDDKIPVNPDGSTTMYIFGGNSTNRPPITYVTESFPGDGVSLTQDHNKAGGSIQFTQKRVVCAHVNGTDVDPAAMQKAGFSESNWDQALWSQAPLYKPVNDEELRDMNLIKYNFTIPSEARVVGVNTPDSNGDLGDDGAGQHRANNSSNNSSKSSNNSSSNSGSSKSGSSKK